MNTQHLEQETEYFQSSRGIIVLSFSYYLLTPQLTTILTIKVNILCFCNILK